MKRTELKIKILSAINLIGICVLLLSSCQKEKVSTVTFNEIDSKTLTIDSSILNKGFSFIKKLSDAKISAYEKNGTYLFINNSLTRSYKGKFTTLDFGLHKIYRLKGSQSILGGIMHSEAAMIDDTGNEIDQVCIDLTQLDAYSWSCTGVGTSVSYLSKGQGPGGSLWAYSISGALKIEVNFQSGSSVPGKLEDAMSVDPVICFTYW